MVQYKNTVTTINTSVSKVTKQLAGAVSLLNTIRGGETPSHNDWQKEYTSAGFSDGGKPISPI